MEIPNFIKIGIVVISGIAFAFFAGYVIFSYFSESANNNQQAQNAQLANNTVKVEDDSSGIVTNGSNGFVEGASTFSATDDGSGISSNPNSNGPVDMSKMEKGGVLSDSTSNPTTQYPDGIVPNNAKPQVNTITADDRANYKKAQKTASTKTVTADDGNDDSKVTVYETPDVDEHSDYVEYTYTFSLNSDARDRYKDGFTYKIDAQSCDSSKYFTDGSHDFSGTVSANDIDKDIDIKVRIKNDYIDDKDNFDDSSYKLDGTNYYVTGDIQVPKCED